MNRRFAISKAVSALYAGAAGTLALSLASTVAKAASKDFSLVITSKVGTNHGHDISFSYQAAVNFLTSESSEGQIALDITGASRHPHSVEITKTDLKQLLNLKTITVISTRDAGHTHDVALSLGAVIK